MPIIASYERKSYPVAPEGLFPAVCVDVVDLGIRRNEKFGKDQHKIRIVWQIEEVNPDTGYRYTASQMFTLSLNPKAQLSQVLESWRGKPFTDKERSGFDVEKLIGAPCQVQIVHRAGTDTVYANVSAVVPLHKSMTAPRAENYTRVKDRPANSTVGEVLGGETGIPTDEGVPF